MKETAKAIKISADVVMLATATVAAFLVSPAVSIDYFEKPRDELKSLKEVFLMAGQYKNMIEQKLDSHRFPGIEPAFDPSRLFVTSARVPTEVSPAPQPPVETKCGDDIPIPDQTRFAAVDEIRMANEIRPEVFEAQVRGNHSGTVSLTWDPKAVKFAKVNASCLHSWGRSLPYRAECPSRFITAADAYKFLLKNQDAGSDVVQIYEPGANDFIKKVRAALATYPDYELVRWEISNPDGTEERVPCASSSGCMVSTARLELEFQDPDGAPVTLCLPVSGMWSCGSCIAIDVMPFMKWVQANSRIKAPLFREEHGRKIWLPESHVVWSTVASKELDEAVVDMNLKIAAQNERISLFSLSASVASAAMAFPAMIAGALWISSLHLWHLSTRRRPKDVDGIREEWFGLLSGFLPLITAVAIIDIAPVLVDAFLLYRLYAGKQVGRDAGTIITHAFLVILSAVAIVHGILLIQARRNLRAR